MTVYSNCVDDIKCSPNSQHCKMRVPRKWTHMLVPNNLLLKNFSLDLS